MAFCAQAAPGEADVFREGGDGHGEGGLVPFKRFPPDRRREIPAFCRAGDRHTRKAQEGGQDVHDVQGGRDVVAGTGQTGAAHDKGDQDRFVPGVLLAVHPVRAEHVAVVGGVDKDRIVGQTLGFEGLPETPKLIVQRGDVGQLGRISISSGG